MESIWADDEKRDLPAVRREERVGCTSCPWQGRGIQLVTRPHAKLRELRLFRCPHVHEAFSVRRKGEARTRSRWS